jgi:hypothetical protein
VDLQPYVIRQGDYLAKLAYTLGFDADTVWGDPKNEQLRQAGGLSQDPNILRPTDMLYIPDENSNALAAYALTLGTTNTFVADTPNVTIRIQFTDASLTSQPYAIQELPESTRLMTDAGGTATFAAPVTLASATIVFSETGAAFAVDIGHLDPINTLSGVFQRLQHLGFIDDANIDPADLQLEPIRAALRAFTATRPGASLVPIELPPVSLLPSSSDSNPPPPSVPQFSGSIPGDNDSPPSSDPPAEEDDAGLSDDGTLDDSTAAQLVAAHGS